MKFSKEVDYRLALAKGFLWEAEEDYRLERWRACVDNAQIATENAGKMALALFGVAPKTHDPARQLAVLLESATLPESITALIRKMLPDLLALDSKTHILTDYGDEASYTLPWDIFTQQTADEALKSARKAVGLAGVLRDAMFGS